MRTLLTILAFILISGVQAQEKDFETQVREISNEITKITKDEKELLKAEVEVINKKIELGELSQEEGLKLKQEASEKRAAAIAQKVAVQEKELQTLVEAKANGEVKDASKETIKIGTSTVTVSSNDWDWDWDWDSWEEKQVKKDKNYTDNKNYYGHRTSSQFVFAFGINSVVIDHDFSTMKDSDYRTNSFFFELGGTGKTRLTEKPSVFYIKYGGSLLWNNLRPTDNRVFVKEGNTTNLETYPINLKNSARLRNIELIFPLHIELDFSKSRVYDDYVRDRQGRGLRIGFGGYGGVRLQTKQFIKYYDNDLKYKEKSRGSYNVSDGIYGLSAYVGYKATSVYMKYDMNPLFKDSDERNVSVGLRFDFN